MYLRNARLSQYTENVSSTDVYKRLVKYKLYDLYQGKSLSIVKLISFRKIYLYIRSNLIYFHWVFYISMIISVRNKNNPKKSFNSTETEWNFPVIHVALFTLLLILSPKIPLCHPFSWSSLHLIFLLSIKEIYYIYFSSLSRAFL